MKKGKLLITMAISSVLIFGTAFSAVAENEETKATEKTEIILQIDNAIMLVNKEEKTIDERGTVPVIQNDRTLLPIRAVVESIGGNVYWDSGTNTATLKYDGTELQLTIESTTATVNGTQKTLDTAPVILNERTMLPIRFVAENFGLEVLWNTETKTITLTKETEKVEDNDNINNTADTNVEKNILIAYYTLPEADGVDAMTSASRMVVDGEVVGNLEYIAGIIHETEGGQLFQIDTVEPYPADHTSIVDIAAEQQEENARPALSTKIENLDSYDIIFLGYPNWWGDMPMSIYTFLEEYDLSGKTIIPFNVHGGSRFSSTIQTIKELQPNATVIENGFTVSRDDVTGAKDDVIQWLEDLSY